MITNISIVPVWVKDIDEALAFYTDVMGFEPKDDVRLGPDFRWCTVVHPAQPELQVHLTTPGPPLPDDLVAAIGHAQDVGGMHGLALNVDDCRQTYDDLVAKGVTFLQTPETRPYGVEALCRDNSGNWIVLIEPTTFTPDDAAGPAEQQAD